MDCQNQTTAVVNTSQAAPAGETAGRPVDYVKYYIMDIAIPSVCALGLVGNLLSLIVLTTEKLSRTLTKMEISAHIGLMALAVSDFLFCFLVLVFTQVNLKPYYEPGNSVIYFDFMANGLITMFIISSTWLIVVMAAERYIAVCHPLWARKVISLKRTRVCIVLVFVVCALSTVPIFLEKKIEMTCIDGTAVYKLVKRNKTFVNLRRIIWAIFYDFVPCAALLYFNLRLIVQIRKAKRLRDEMTPKQSVILYSSSGTRTVAHQFDSKQDIAFNSSDVSRKTRTKNPHLWPNYLEVPTRANRSSQSSSQKGHERRDYTKLEVYSNGKEPNPRRNEFQAMGGSGRDTNSAKYPANTAPKKRPSDSAKYPANTAPKKRPSDSAKYPANTAPKKRPSDSALNGVTATLVAVVLLFLILVSPSELLKFSVSFSPADRDLSLIVTYVTNCMQVLNFSLNFVLYCAVNKTFRHTLRGLTCCCWLSLQSRVLN